MEGGMHMGYCLALSCRITLIAFHSGPGLTAPWRARVLLFNSAKALPDVVLRLGPAGRVRTIRLMDDRDVSNRTISPWEVGLNLGNVTFECYSLEEQL